MSFIAQIHDLAWILTEAWRQNELSDTARQKIAGIFFHAASYLTEFLSLSHMWFVRSILPLNTFLYESSSSLSELVFRTTLFVSSLMTFIVGVPLGSLGVTCRLIGQTLSTEPYLYFAGALQISW